MSEPMNMQERARKSLLYEAITRDAGMDWEQVRLNGGPPCFHREDNGTLCGRAERWFGHDGDPHKFTSLAEYRSLVEREALEKACKAMCWRCAENLPLVGMRHDYENIVNRRVSAECLASAIRSLMEPEKGQQENG
jgi:hypothetical protein